MMKWPGRLKIVRREIFLKGGGGSGGLPLYNVNASIESENFLVLMSSSHIN